MDIGKYFDDIPLLRVLVESVGEMVGKATNAIKGAGEAVGSAMGAVADGMGSLLGGRGGDDAPSAPAVQGEKLGRSASIHNNKGAGEQLARGEFDVDFNDVTVPNVGTAFKAPSQGAMVG